MPDPYGNPTPQEVIAGIRQNSRKQFMLAQQSGSPGVQAGASLAAIFGGAVKKTIDTRQARQEEVTRLMQTQDMSKEQAWDTARSTIGREHAEVRRARRIQDASSDVQEFLANMPAEIPEDLKRAYGKRFLADRLRSMGMTTEANNLSNMASEEIQAARDRQLNIDNLKARTRSSLASAEKTEAEIPYVGATPFLENVMKKEEIIAKLQDPNSTLTAEQRQSLMRQKGHLEAKILKDETLVGRTDADLRDPILMRKMFNDLADNNVLVANIDDAIMQFEDLDNFEKTFWAGAAKDFLGFAERYFGRKPTESEAQFMKRIQEKEGKSTLIAAKVRHALTGAQMSAFEIVYLTPFLPSPDDPVEVALNKLRIVRDYTALDSDVRLQMYMDGSLESWAAGAGRGNLSNPATQELEDDDPNLTPEERAQRRLDRQLRERGAKP